MPTNNYSTIKNLKYKFLSLDKKTGMTITGLSSFKNPKFLFFVEKLRHSKDILGWSITPQKINSDTYDIVFKLKTTEIKPLTFTMPSQGNNISIDIPNNTRYIIICGFLTSANIPNLNPHGYSAIRYKDNFDNVIDDNGISKWNPENYYGERDFGVLMGADTIEHYLMVDNYISNYRDEDIYNKKKILNIYFYNFSWVKNDVLNLICYTTTETEVTKDSVRDFKLNVMVVEGDLN